MVEKFDYTDVEWRRRKELLEKVGQGFQDYMLQHSRSVTVSKIPTAILSVCYEVNPRGWTAPATWETLYKDILDKVRSIADQINSDPESRVGDRKMRHSVLPFEPVYRWHASRLMADLHTGRVEQGVELREIQVSFLFPYTPQRGAAAI